MLKNGPAGDDTEIRSAVARRLLTIAVVELRKVCHFDEMHKIVFIVEVGRRG